ncbi:MAG TPA: class I SAM-dependent methyltransferase [Candidatus Babeliales bacterium]|nr:class I SAM-dependent methyltransferase [Candidatus Babeliales bacterium]
MRFIIAIFIILVVPVLFYVFKPNRWNIYFQEHNNNPPRELIVRAINDIIEKKDAMHAIDFGFGNGNETVFLLQHGFSVTAIDAQDAAFMYLEEKTDAAHFAEKLQTIKSDFSQVDWSIVPKADVFVASLSMPFVLPDNFVAVWHSVIKQIKPGGYFVGHFFDPKFEKFSKFDRKNMNFFTKQELLDLFVDFKIHYFNTTTNESNEPRIHEIIAQKR